MKKNFNNMLLSSTIITATLATAGSIIIPVTIAGDINNNSSINYNNLDYSRNAKKSKNEVSEVSKINNELIAEINKINTNRYGLWNDSVATTIIPIYKKYILNLEKSMNTFQTVDGKMIGESIVARWTTVIKGLEAKSYYLGDNGSGVLDAYSNQESRNIALLNQDLRKPIPNDTEANAVTNSNSRIANIDEYIKHIENLIANLKEGLNNGVNFSQIYLKMFLQSLLGGFRTNYGIFTKEIEALKANSELVFDSNFIDKNTGVRIASFNGIGFLQDSGITNIIDSATSLPTANKEALKNKINDAQIIFDKFLSFLIGDYWFNATIEETSPKTYYGKSTINQDAYVLKGSTTANLENSFSGITGMGFVPADLDVKDVGIGFSRNGKMGIEIYEYMLGTRTSDNNLVSADLVNNGQNKVKVISQRMTEIAKIVSKIKTGNETTEWAPTVRYDTDGFGPIPAADKVLAIRDANGAINLENFFLWLNNEEWFYGRDRRVGENAQSAVLNASEVPTSTNQYKNIINVETLGVLEPWNPQPTSQKLPLTNVDINVGNVLGGPNVNNPNNLGDAGNLYNKWVTDANNGSNPIVVGGVVGNDAYIGATHSINSYLKYKKSTQPSFQDLFKNVRYDYNLKSGTGGAAYASVENLASPTGSTYFQPTFYLDIDPYFGLQKWSVSTLSTHEAVPGHDFQFAYAETYPATEDAPSIRNSAYSEGWGLFTEFLATRINIYGDISPITLPSTNPNSELERLTLPKFGTNGTSIKLAQQNNASYQFDNGVYSDSNGEQSQTLYEALQYFGFLNERQLRAMRLYLDSASQTGNGNGTTGTGLSINGQREYMSKNSALGFGDISRESYRYLGYVGQATAYTTGQEIIEDAFIDASYNYQKANPDKLFIDPSNLPASKDNTQGLFDLILRNGAVALEPLNNYVNGYVNQTFPPPVAPSSSSLEVGGIVGIVLGSIAFISVIIALSTFLYIKKIKPIRDIEKAIGNEEKVSK